MTSFVAFLALVFAAPTTLAITPAIQAQQAALRGIQGVTGAQQQQQDSLFGAYPYGGFGLGHGLYNGLNRFGFHGLGFGYPYAADPTAQAATASSILSAQPQAADNFPGGFGGFGLKALGLRGLGFRGFGFGGFGLNKFPHAADPATQAILTAAADPATQALLTTAADPTAAIVRAVQQQQQAAADPATAAILRAVQQQQQAAADPATAAILRAVQQQQQAAADPLTQAIARAAQATQAAADGYYKYKYHG